MPMPDHLKRLIEKETAKQYGISSSKGGINRDPMTPRPATPPPAQSPAKKRNGRSSIFEAELEWTLRRTPGIPPFECNARALNHLVPPRQHEVDFLWRKEKIAVELEGGIWQRGGGGHSRPVGILRDMEKSNLLALEGYRVLRFTTDQHRRGEIIPFLLRFFA